jgi:ATP-dependent DNA helicase RecG
LCWAILRNEGKSGQRTPKASQHLDLKRRRSNLFVWAKVAAATEAKVDYIKRRGIDDEYSKKLVLDFLGELKEATRQEINQLLMDKLSDSLSEDQKKSHIKNLLQEMRR